VGLVVVAALVAGRRRLARDLVLAGFLAWASARALGEIVDAHESIAHSLRIAVGFAGAPSSYPSVRVAIIVAVIVAAAPYVTRPARVLGWLIVVLLGVSALYLGVAFPNDLVAGVVLGVTVASLVHLLFGSPGTRPTIPQITQALAHLGVDAHDVCFATEQPTSSTLVLAEDEHGPLRIRVVGRDDAHHQLLAKLWTSLVNKGSSNHFVRLNKNFDPVVRNVFNHLNGILSLINASVSSLRSFSECIDSSSCGVRCDIRCSV